MKRIVNYFFSYSQIFYTYMYIISKALLNLLFSGVFTVTGSLGLYLGSVRAGRILHAALVRNIMASPMMFFDTTPVGRILNRFSKDVDVIDNVIAKNFHSWLGLFLKCITSAVVIGYTTPMFIVVAVPIVIFNIVVQVSLGINE